MGKRRASRCGLSRSVFFCDQVVIESICYRTRANQLTNENNTTGGLGIIRTFFVSSCWPTRDHIEVYLEFQPSYDIFHRWCQGFFRPQVPCTPSLRCPITNPASTQSQQPGRLIKSSRLRVSSSTQATLEQSPIQVLTKAQRCLTSVVVRELVFPS